MGPLGPVAPELVYQINGLSGDSIYYFYYFLEEKSTQNRTMFYRFQTHIDMRLQSDSCSTFVIYIDWTCIFLLHIL